jgi:hypothetical protein
MNRRYPMKQFLIVLAVLLMPAVAVAQETDNVRYIWEAPTSGAPAVLYVVQHSTDDAQTWETVAQVDTTAYTLAASRDQTHRIRVAGKDDAGRQGPWSIPSDLLNTPPGPPGQPTVVSIILGALFLLGLIFFGIRQRR